MRTREQQLAETYRDVASRQGYLRVVLREPLCGLLKDERPYLLLRGAIGRVVQVHFRRDDARWPHEVLVEFDSVLTEGERPERHQLKVSSTLLREWYDRERD